MTQSVTIDTTAYADGAALTEAKLDTTFANTEVVIENVLNGAQSFDQMRLDEVAAPGTPASGKVYLYAKSDGKVYIKDDAGLETDITTGGGSGASTALSNLASVAINTTLVSDTNNTDDLGSTTVYWRNLYAYTAYMTEQAAPSTPAANKVVIYPKSDGLMYSKDDAGIETLMSGGSGSTPLRSVQAGLKLRWLANDKILVTGGSVVHGTTVINKTVGTVLTMGTAGDWIDGASGEAASAFASVYINSSGTLKLHDTLPNNSSSTAATYVANMRVNQVGWVGTSGNGLDATSVVYDTDTGEGSITAGMLVGFYSDAAYTTGRGKATGAAASLDDMSFALITAVNTGTNTLTLEAGHNTAINDNDYMIVIEFAPVVYRDESATVWRWLGAMYNNGSSNLDTNRTYQAATYTANEGTDYTTTSATMGNLDGTNFNHDLILTEVADVQCSLIGATDHSAASARTYFGLLCDGIQQYADDGLTLYINADAASANRTTSLAYTVPVRNLLPGTHNFKPQWKTSASTATMSAGAGTANKDTHAAFTARIIGQG